MDAKQLGIRIGALRKERGLTMRQLAERTGVSHGQISRLENGKQGFRSDTLLRIARALDVQPYAIYMPEKAAQIEGAARRIGGTLRRALKDPQFVSLMEVIAEVRRKEPAKFRVVEKVIGIVLGDD